MTNTTVIVLVAIVFLVIGVLLATAFNRLQRTKQLKERFSSEYDHALNEIGDKRQAESELQARVDHVEKLNIRPLTAEETDRFTREWQTTQTEFVDQPMTSVQKANQLIKDAMSVRGYPVDDFEQRAADISVDHPDLVANYRELHAIAVKSNQDGISTEEMRQAMVHGRALFHDLVQPEIKVEDPNQKEKV